MEREELRTRLDTLSRQKAAATERIAALEEHQRKVREIELSREKVLARYRNAVPEALEKTEGTRRRTVYNTLGVTVWAARTRDDPIRMEMSALGSEKVCHNDATSRWYFPSANPARLKLTLIYSDGDLEAAFTLNHNVI
jgi:hypothetical protein